MFYLPVPDHDISDPILTADDLRSWIPLTSELLSVVEASSEIHIGGGPDWKIFSAGALTLLLKARDNVLTNKPAAGPWK